MANFKRKRRYDRDQARDGVWFEVYDENLDISFGEFKCGLFEAGSPLVIAAAERMANDGNVRRPTASKAKVTGKSELEQDKEGLRIAVKNFCESFLVDWKGIEDDDGPVPFSPKTAIEFFDVDDQDAMWIIGKLFAYASDATNFQPEEQTELPEKNSVAD